ncbi:MAG: glycosyltransferase, partial [Chloroflexi bacterium]|nr:glycosyltransferase [Chloroflexota bacterium]
GYEGDLLRRQYRHNLQLGDDVVVGTVGRISAEKGHRSLLEAWHSLIQKRPACRLLLVGDGPERSALERYVAERGLTSTVHFLGTRNDVPEVLRSLDLFVLPSLEDSHPVALLEAMAAGLPVVATRVGGIPEILGDGQYGTLAAPNDPDSLEAAIIKNMDDREFSARMGAAARQRAEHAFDIEVMVDSVIKVYDSICRGVVSHV